MIVREYKSDDFEQIRSLHAGTGYGFALPDLSSKSVFSRHVITDGAGIAMAAFLQRTAQVFLISNRSWKTPAWRLAAMEALVEAGREDARRDGVAEVNAFVVPQIQKQFGRRLKRMGWDSYKEGKEWRCYTCAVEANRG